MPEVLPITASNNQEASQQKCSKCEQRVLFLLLSVFPLFLMINAVRLFTAVTPQQYYWPCNITDIISDSEIFVLEEEKRAYTSVISRYEQSPSKDKFSAEIENIKLKQKDVETKLKVQDCYRQKCAKINIDADIEAIKDKALTTSTWLFRIAAILILLNGILGYHKRKIVDFGFGVYVFLSVAPIFINACLSMKDYSDMPNFRVNC